MFEVRGDVSRVRREFCLRCKGVFRIRVLLLLLPRSVAPLVFFLGGFFHVSCFYMFVCVLDFGG